VLHSQDSITANALADLRDEGRIDGFLRTVHHLDTFDEPQLIAWQARGVRTAQQLMCVSALWQGVLARDWGRQAHRVGNGVNLQRHVADTREAQRAADAEVLRRLGLTHGTPYWLAVGGVEGRKNTARLLHAFALVQDDVMDQSDMRRGRPSAHRAFERWHHERGLPGSSARFGESAAVLLGDLCLVWAEQMLRESGVDATALARAWPRYDALRTELAVGQFADLVNDSAAFPSLAEVLDVARRKSGNYTVRRPLEIGAALAGCDDTLLGVLGRYGAAIGEAFQLRDDLLGVFGAPATTGKPTGTDLIARKATTVVVAGYELAAGAQQRQFKEFMTADHLGSDDVTRWQALISEVGTVEWIEDMIDQRFTAAVEALGSLSRTELGAEARSALIAMASACTERAA
jgi:geranylgeranyl diphosphate synthase type I